MPWCSRVFSAYSARPVRAAEPWRFMLSDEGGVGTMSSSRVRRARLRRGTLAAGAAARRLARGGLALRPGLAEVGARFARFPAFARLAPPLMAFAFLAPR